MTMFLKRPRQFFRALFSKMTQDDLAMVSKYLSKDEKQLFFNMDPAIQKHCVNVAFTVQNMLKDRPGTDHGLLMKAALLHDIGKPRGSLTLMDRVWYVLVRKASRRLAEKLARPGKGGFLARLRYAFYIHINHGEIGASIAQNSGLGEDLVFLLRHHHDQAMASRSVELALLLLADELN
ncbi:MAG: HDOD domain-containing protein [Eubacteriales bacterium]